jgi:predicted CopG family antitoxin
MASPKKEFRCPQELLDAAESRAAKQGLSFSDYIRSLIERDTGTSVQIEQGFQAFSKTKLLKAHREARKTRKKNAKKAAS